MASNVETNVVWWAAPVRLTHAHWRSAHTECVEAISGGAVGVDWAACTQLDSSALALILAAQRKMSKNAVLQHKNTPDQLLQLARLQGVADLLGMTGRSA